MSDQVVDNSSEAFHVALFSFLSINLSTSRDMKAGNQDEDFSINVFDGGVLK